MIGDLFSPSEYSYVMNDLKDYPNLEDVSVGQLLEPLEVYNPNTNNDGEQLENKPMCNVNVNPSAEFNYDSEQSESKPVVKRRRQSKMCDSTMKASTSNLEALPCLTPFPGQFDFQLFLPVDIAAHRWTFSKPLNKVFIDIEKVLALQFKWNYFHLKPEVQLYVRALPVYTSPDWMKIPVMRCPLHLLPDHQTNTGFPFVDHVIRCEHSSTQYEKDDMTSRLSCVTPLSYPQPGSETTTLTYKFVCKTSCPSGMDRKPISVIFTLEDCHGYVYGRQPLAVKICSCPKRDKQKEEHNELEKTRTTKIARSRSSTADNVSIKNSRGASTSTAEHLKDLQSEKGDGKTSDSASTGSESESVARRIAEAKPSTSGVSMKKPRKCTCNGAANQDRIIALLSEMPNEIVNKMHTRHTSAFEVFGRSIAAQLEDLPAQQAYELQADFQKMILMKRLQVSGTPAYNQSTCLTPAPSLASPEPNDCEMSSLRTPSTPVSVRMYTML